MPLITKEGVRGDSRLKIGYLQSIDFQHHRFLLYGRDALNIDRMVSTFTMQEAIV